MNSFRSLFKALASILCFSVLLSIFGSCSKDDDPPPPPAPGPVKKDSTKLITYFTLKNANGTSLDTTDLSVVIKNDSILVGVAFGTDITRLTPVIEFKGVIMTPASGVEQDFTKPVIYTLTAADSSSRKYVVAVKHRPIRNRVFVGGSGKNFYALDAKTGSLKWKYTGTGWFSYSSPAFKDSIVYTTSTDNYVYAFHAISGDILWKYKLGTTSVIASVTLSGNTVLCGGDNTFYALDALDGSLKWKYTAGYWISAGAVVENGVVYFGCDDSYVYALNAVNGSLKWKYAMGNISNNSGPALANGILYIGSRDSYVHAINANTGAPVWKYYTGVSLEMSSPTVVNGVVYIGGWYDVSDFTKKGSVYAINAATGTLVWESLAKTGIGSSPLVSNGMLYISADGGIFHALNASTGSQVWSKQILPNGADAAVANGNVFVGGGGSWYFYAYDAASGAEKWKFYTPGDIDLSGPLVIDSVGVAHYSSGSGMQQ
jgi:outer membrane protein assembly factor BamB